MRRLLALLAVVVVACSKGDGPTAPPPAASVNFRVDALTCRGSATVLFFVDGTQIGAQELAAGSTSQTFTIAAGSHTAGARTATSSFIWPTSNFTVPASTIYTVVLTC